MRRGMLAGPRFRGARAVREALGLSIPNAGSALESHARVLLVLSDVPGIESIAAQAAIRDPATPRPRDPATPRPAKPTTWTC